MNDNLFEFMNERVLATREVAHVQYLVDSDTPATGVAIDCPETAITVVLLPTFVRDALHMEIHFFVDGQRQTPEFLHHPAANGQIELIVRRAELSG